MADSHYTQEFEKRVGLDLFYVDLENEKNAKKLQMHEKWYTFISIYIFISIL
jgi:hypothetical protein